MPSRIVMTHPTHGTYSAYSNHPVFAQPISEVRARVQDIAEGDEVDFSDLTDLEARIVSADCTPSNDGTW